MRMLSLLLFGLLSSAIFAGCVPQNQNSPNVSCTSLNHPWCTSDGCGPIDYPSVCYEFELRGYCNLRYELVTNNCTCASGTAPTLCSSLNEADCASKSHNPAGACNIAGGYCRFNAFTAFPCDDVSSGPSLPCTSIYNETVCVAVGCHWDSTSTCKGQGAVCQSNNDCCSSKCLIRTNNDGGAFLSSENLFSGLAKLVETPLNGTCVSCWPRGYGPCSSDADCCISSMCINGICSCIPNGQNCSYHSECCSGKCLLGEEERQPWSAIPSSSSVKFYMMRDGKCVPCWPRGTYGCLRDSDCCSNSVCINGRCSACSQGGQQCTKDSDCCDSDKTIGLRCENGVCKPKKPPTPIISPTPTVIRGSNVYCIQNCPDSTPYINISYVFVAQRPGNIIPILFLYRKQEPLNTSTFENGTSVQLYIQAEAKNNPNLVAKSDRSNPTNVAELTNLNCANASQPCSGDNKIPCCPPSICLNGICCLQNGQLLASCQDGTSNECCSGRCFIDEESQPRCGIGCNQSCTISSDCPQTCSICAAPAGSSQKICSVCIQTNSTTNCTENSQCCSGLCDLLSTSANFSKCVDCLPLNHTCRNHSECCSNRCLFDGEQTFRCAPPLPTCGQQGALCTNDTQCCEGLFCDLVNTVAQQEQQTYSRDYFFKIKKLPFFFEGIQDYGRCTTCFPTNSRCDDVHPCCDPNAVCNVTRTSGSVKYCIIPPGVGSQSFLFNNWIKQGNGIFEPEHNIVKSGSTSVKIYSSDPSSYIYSSALYSALKGNRNYLLEFWARGELQNDAIRYAIVDVQNQMYLAPSGQWNSLNPGADIFITKQLSTTFERITQPFSTLQNAVIELRFYTPLNNQVVYLDDVSVTEINDFTMSVWIRPYTGQGSFARLFYQLGQEFGAAQGIDWFLNPANFLNISFYSANGSGQSSQISHLLDLSDGNWHMVSVSVRRLGEYNIYLDDKSVASGQFSLLRINSSSPFFIGASDSSGSNGFRGLIDEIRFYKRALSEREIENHYKGLYQDKCSLDLDVFYKPSASFSNITANYNAKLRLKRQLPDALLSLPFDYREVEGISVDYSPLLLHANVSANWTPFGKIGGAYNFTSLFSHLSVPSPVLQGRDDFTVSLWVKPKSVISSQIISNQIQNSGFALELSDGYLNFIAANKVISSPIELATDEWTHITVSRKDGVGFIYINGVLYATGDVSGDLGQTYPRLIIGNSPSLNKPYEGIIDEVQIFKRALSEDEIRALYNQGFTVSITTLNS